MYGFKSFAVVFILISASITDIRKRNFPVIYQILLLCLVPIGFKTEHIMGTALAVPFFVACILNDEMGGGDWKAVALLGLISGIHHTLCSVLLGCVFFILFGKVSERIKGKETSLPFIPFLSAGYIIYYFLEVL